MYDGKISYAFLKFGCYNSTFGSTFGLFEPHHGSTCFIPYVSIMVLFGYLDGKMLTVCIP